MTIARNAMSPHLYRHAAALAVVLALGACATPPSTAPSQLVAVGAPEVRTAGDGTLWLWQSTVASDGSGFAPPSPHRFTIRFLNEGRLEVRTDCNRGTGKWLAHPDGVIIIGAFTLSKLPCGRDSLDRVFLDALSRVNRFAVVAPDELRLSLPRGTGTMTFQALGPDRLAGFEAP